MQDSIKTYRDIPGLTVEEISEIEKLTSKRDFFSYGACLATEAFELPDGSLSGFASKFCDLLSELFETEFIPEIYDWDILIADLASGAVDFTGELTATEERMKIYGMSLPIAERMLRIFTLTDSEIETEADVNDLKLGFLTDSVTADSVLESYNLTFECVDVDNYEAAAAMLNSGEIDAFIEEAVADPAFSEYDFIKSRVFFPMVHDPVSMTAADPELAPLIYAVSKYIEAGGFDRLYELYREGDFEYSKYKLNKSFTDKERAYADDLINRGAAVTVAYEHDNYPVSFYNEKDGEFEGIAVDVLAEIGRLTDIRFEPAASTDETWAEIFEKLNSGEACMVPQLLSSGSYNDSLLWGASPYAHSHFTLMSKSDYPNLESYQVSRRTVGALRGSGIIDVFREFFPDHETLVLYDTRYDCLDALERGEIDLLMASEYMLLMQINYREKTGFKINLKLDSPLDSRFGFAGGEEVLCSVIDKAQQYVNTGLIEMNWTSRSFDYTKRLAEESARYLTIFLIIMFFVLAATVFMLLKNIKLSKKLREIANYDALTGIYTRRFFTELASFQIARSVRTGVDCFIIIFDLDHFKSVNDTHGHQAGDEVLREMAKRVKKTIRPYDILGRYGGEEFIILMTDVRDINKDNAIFAVERIRQEICKTPVDFEKIKIPISASFGISYAAPMFDLPTATKHADKALYTAKETGRNKVVFSEADNKSEQADR
ncbi:MAG: GGDEF domain-containing protein [Oscillospiraceae bacterium]|nr:GGDEF domain-containing protein [Oscillospiraceae bacterium]